MIISNVILQYRTLFINTAPERRGGDLRKTAFSTVLTRFPTPETVETVLFLSEFAISPN